MTPDHPIRRAALTGQARAGWTLFEALERPTPEDCRWAGTCAIYLGDFDAARRELERAVQCGYLEGQTHLALIYRLKNNMPLAELTLKRLEQIPMDSLERCLYLIQRGMWLTGGYRLADAKECLEEGFLLSFEALDGHLVRPGLALNLGVVRFMLGDHIAALSDLEHAKEGGIARATLAAGYRAVVLAHLSRFEEAHRELETVASKLEAVPVACDMYGYWVGTVLRLEGQFERARAELQAALERARESGEGEIEAHALLGLSVCCLALGDREGARVALLRAEMLCRSPGLEAMLLLRGGQFERSGLKLEQATTRLDALGMAREALYAALSRAEVEGGTLEQLDPCADRLHRLGARLALESELYLLPRSRATLEALPETHPARVLIPLHTGFSIRRARLRVLGGEGITLGGQAVRLEYALSPAILYYLIRYPGRTAKQIVADLMPEREFKSSSQYFYKARLELQAALPGLVISNNPRTGHWLEFNSLSITVDALEVRDLLERGAVEGALEQCALLLPRLEGDWAEEERNQLMQFMTRMALGAINEHFSSGDYERCVRIATQILGSDPLDPTLNEVYLRALLELNGPVAAQQAAQKTQARFAKEGLEPPYELEAFMRSSLN